MKELVIERKTQTHTVIRWWREQGLTEVVKDHAEELAEAAEERIKEMVAQGHTEGELRHVVRRGILERAYAGWWSVRTDDITRVPAATHIDRSAFEEAGGRLVELARGSVKWPDGRNNRFRVALQARPGAEGDVEVLFEDVNSRVPISRRGLLRLP